MAAISTFVENFDTLDTTSKWDTGVGPGASSTIVAGRLRQSIPKTATYNRVFARGAYDLTNSATYVQMVTPMTVSPAQDGPDCGFVLHVGNWGDGNWFGWSLDSYGKLNALRINAFVPTTIFSLTYNASTHKWLRIRADATKVYFDTAPATAANPPVSSDWVNRGEILQSALGMAITALHPQLYVSSWANTTGDPTYAEWDGLNTVAQADTAIIPAGWAKVYSRDYAALGAMSLNAGMNDAGIDSDSGEFKPVPFRYRNWSTVGLNGFAYDVYIDPFASGLPAEYLSARPLGEIEPIPGVGVRLHSRPMTGAAMRSVVSSQFPDAMSKAGAIGKDPWLTATIGTYIKIAARPPFARETYFIPRNSFADGMWAGAMWSTEDGNRAWPNDTLHKPFEYDDHEFLGRGASAEWASTSIHAYKTIAFDQPAMHQTIGDFDPASVGLSNFVNQKIGVRTIFDTSTIKTYYNVNDGEWTLTASVNVTTQLTDAEYDQYHTAFLAGCGAGVPWISKFPSVPLAIDIVSTAIYAPSTNTQVRVPATTPPAEVTLAWRGAYGSGVPSSTAVGTTIADLTLPAGATSASVITYGGRLTVVGTELRVAASLTGSADLRFHLQGQKADGAKSVGRLYQTSITSGVTTSTGSLNGKEASPDTLSSTGKTAASGTLAALETGADKFLAVSPDKSNGTLAALEVGADQMAAAVKVLVTGVAQVAEANPADAFAAGGVLSLAGTMAAAEPFLDNAYIAGAVTLLRLMFPALPSGPDSTKYAIEVEDVAIRTELEGGYVASRPRHTRPPRRTWTVGYTEIKDTDKQTLVAFYEQVRGGSYIFDWLNDEDGQVYQVRFLERLTLHYKGIGPTKLWDVTIRLEQA